MSGRYNWDGSSHQRLYDEIHGNAGFWGTDGAGVSGANGTQEGWAELASVMARAYERTEAALAKAGAEWEGGAAEAMRSGVTPLSQWAVDAHDASTASAASTDTHVVAYTAAKNRMPEPVPVTSTANSDGLGIPAMFTHLLGGQTDQDRQEAAAQEAKAEAVRIMTGYEAESGFAQAGVGQFVPPPTVTVAVASPQPTGGGDGIPVGGSEPPQAGRGDGTSPPRDTSGGTGGSSAPPGTAASSAPAATTPSFTTTPPPPNPVTTGVLPEQPRGTSLVVPPPGGINHLGERGTTGRGPAGGDGAGHGSGTGRGPGAGGGLRGGPLGGPGGLPGATGSGPVNEPVAGRTAGGVNAGARGAGAMGGMAPAAGRADGDEDTEHKTAEYLRDFHDGFWDDTPPVAPAVIGEDED